MRALVILALISTVFAEVPPYPASGWRPQGEPFTLPSRQQQPQQQYGAPPQNERQQYNTIQFSAPQQLNQQYGAPQINNQYDAPQVNQQQYNTNQQNGASQINRQYAVPQINQQQQYNNQFSSQQLNQQYGAPQINNQYGAPSVDSLRTQNAPQINNQYGAPPTNNQYGAPSVDPLRTQNSPQINNQYGAPSTNNQYGAPPVDPLRTQNVPREDPTRNFAGNNFNFNQIQPTTPGTTYLSQTPVNNNQNGNQQQFNSNFDSSSNNPNLNNRQQQSGKLISQNAFASNQNFQNVEPFNQRQNFNQNPLRAKEEISDSDELNQDQLDEQSENLNGEDFTPERGYGTPTTTKRPIKAPKKPERTTPRPRTTTEQPDNDGDFDQPNVAISTAVAGSSSTGQYYILQPDGRLQRVVYMTSPDPQGDKSAAVVANLMYETVEPLRGPIYQYVGSELVRIN